MIELRHLRYFLAIAEHGSLRKAAERIFVAQSSLSRAVRVLEESLDVVLLERRARGVELTAPGRRLAETSRKILADVDALPSSVRSGSGGIGGSVVLGASAGGARLFFGRIAARIRRQHPDIELALVEGLQYSLLEGLDRGRIDLAMLVAPDASARIESHLLATEPAYVIGPLSDSRLPTDSCTVADLAGLPLVVYPESTGSRQLLERVARDCGTTLEVAYEVESQDVLRDLVARGLGFGVVSYSSASQARREDPSLGSASVNGLTFRREIAWRSGRVLEPAVAAVLETIQDEVCLLASEGDLSVQTKAAVPTESPSDQMVRSSPRSCRHS